MEIPNISFGGATPSTAEATNSMFHTDFIKVLLRCNFNVNIGTLISPLNNKLFGFANVGGLLTPTDCTFIFDIKNLQSNALVPMIITETTAVSTTSKFIFRGNYKLDNDMILHTGQDNFFFEDVRLETGTTFGTIETGIHLDNVKIICNVANAPLVATVATNVIASNVKTNTAVIDADVTIVGEALLVNASFA
jgi:hypothetical protein